MLMSIVVLVVSTALFFFYIQAICEKALRHEFSRPYFKLILQSLQLEYPQLQDSISSNAPFSYSSSILALKCDFFTLKYLLKNSDPTRQPLSRSQKLLVFYFRALLLLLPLRHAFRLHEKEAVLKLSTILQFFANSLGERLSDASLASAQAGIK